MGQTETDDDFLDEREPSEGEDWLRQAARASYVSRREGDRGSKARLPEPGEVVAEKYRIEEPLGVGGMGAVFRATHVVSEKPVAIKWMLRSSSDEAALQRFTREARAAGRIAHPNVVDVYDIGGTEQCAYLVMELLRGESLAERLRRDGRLPPTEAVDLLVPALRGVAEAHRQGVVHRDLKPANIFLPRAPDGTPLGAKVLDFGISMVKVRDEKLDPTLTKDGTLLGTPAYMPKEQLENARSADARTDVYALGVILYEALSGELPFRADSYSALVIAITSKAPRALAELCPSIPPALTRVVSRAMHADRDARYADVPALIEALAPFGSAPISVGSTGAHVAVPATTAGARSLVLGLAALVVIGAAWWMLRTEPAATAAEPVRMDAAPAAAQAQAQAPVPPVIEAAPAAAPEAPAPGAAPQAVAPATVTRVTPTQPSAAQPRQPARGVGSTEAGAGATRRARVADSSPERTDTANTARKTPRAGQISMDDL